MHVTKLFLLQVCTGTQRELAEQLDWYREYLFLQGLPLGALDIIAFAQGPGKGEEGKAPAQLQRVKCF